MTTHTAHAIPSTTIEPTQGLAALGLKDVWAYRELLYFLVWRDVKVRYKQTVLGVLWVVLQPLVSMIIFTVLFGVLLKEWAARDRHICYNRDQVHAQGDLIAYPSNALGQHGGH